MGFVFAEASDRTSTLLSLGTPRPPGDTSSKPDPGEAGCQNGYVGETSCW